MDVTPPESSPPRRRWVLAQATILLAASLLLGQFLYDRALRLTETQDRLWLGDEGAWFAYLTAQLLAGAWVVAGGFTQQNFAIARGQTGFLTTLAIAAASLFPFGHLLSLSLDRTFISDHFPGMTAVAIRRSGLTWGASLYRAINTLLAPTQGAAVVAALWITLLVAGHWRRPVGLLDWAGVALGGGYLALFFMDAWQPWRIGPS